MVWTENTSQNKELSFIEKQQTHTYIDSRYFLNNYVF